MWGTQEEIHFNLKSMTFREASYTDFPISIIANSPLEIKKDSYICASFKTASSSAVYRQALLSIPEEIIKHHRHILPLAVKTDKKNRMYAEWAMLFGLCEKLLEWNDSGRLPVALNEDLKLELTQYFRQAYGFTNVEDNETGIQIKGLFKELEKRRLIKEENGKYRLSEKEEIIATWAKSFGYIGQKLQALFKSDGTIGDENRMMSFIAAYAYAADEFPLAPVEARQPFLRAVLDLEPRMRQSVVSLLLQQLVKENPETEYYAFLSSILLMLRAINDLETWGGICLKDLKNRRIYLLSPENTLLKGGLGRVMQYLTRALKALGLEVIIVEPYYPYEIDKEELKKRIADKSIDWEDPPLKALDYEKLPIPLRVPKKPNFHVSVKAQEKECTVDVFKTENDEHDPVYLFRDKDEFFTKLLYFYGKGQNHPTAFQVSEFLTKAGLKVIDHIENRMMKDEGDSWKPPVIASNDGQALLASVWSIFHKDFQTNALVLAHYMSTTHTYRNTIYGEGEGARQYLLRAGVPENWLWLFKRLMPKGDGRYVYDLTRAGLIATLIRYGFANGRKRRPCHGNPAFYPPGFPQGNLWDN